MVTASTVNILYLQWVENRCSSYDKKHSAEKGWGLTHIHIMKPGGEVAHGSRQHWPTFSSDGVKGPVRWHFWKAVAVITNTAITATCDLDESMCFTKSHLALLIVYSARVRKQESKIAKYLYWRMYAATVRDSLNSQMKSAQTQRDNTTLQPGIVLFIQPSLDYQWKGTRGWTSIWCIVWQ